MKEKNKMIRRDDFLFKLERKVISVVTHMFSVASNKELVFAIVQTLFLSNGMYFIVHPYKSYSDTNRNAPSDSGHNRSHFTVAIYTKTEMK